MKTHNFDKWEDVSSSSDSKITMLSTTSIKLFIDKLKNERNRSSTRQTYYNIWKIFNKFYIKLDEKPSSWEERIILFAGYLVNLGRKASTVKTYVLGIKAVLLENDKEVHEDRFLLTSLTKACRFRNSEIVTRLPIQKWLTNIIVIETLRCFALQPYLASLYSAIFITAYYGMLHIREVTKGSHPILARDVQIGINKKKILFILRSSKTHWIDSKPQLIKISSKLTRQHNQSSMTRDSNNITAKNICPYQILLQYVDCRQPQKSNSEPFFIFQDGHLVLP